MERDDEFQQLKGQKSFQFCRTLVEELVGRAFAFGASLQLSKQIQFKFETRPVIREVFIALKDFSVDVLDTLPKSVYTSGQTGRLLYVDRQSVMH